MKKIVIGSDRTGFPLKETLKKHLISSGYEVDDVGNLLPEENQLYFEVASKLAMKIQSGEYEKGILACGTGMGMNIVANKFKGIHAGVVESTYSATMCAAINQVNVLTMGAFIIGEKMAIQAVEKWLGTEYLDGIMEERKSFIQQAYSKVKEIEELNFKVASIANKKE